MKIHSVKEFHSVSKLNNKGFTLLEMLFCLAIFCMLIVFIPITFQSILREDLLSKRLQHLEWEVFLSQFKKEIRMSDRISVSNNKVYLWENGSIIIYEKYGLNIRRRVDYSGHEVVLQQVDTLTFSEVKNGVEIMVKDSYGQLNQATLRSYIDVSDEL